MPKSFQILAGILTLNFWRGKSICNQKHREETQAGLKNTFLGSRYLTFSLIWNTQPGETSGSDSGEQVVYMG